MHSVNDLEALECNKGRFPNRQKIDNRKKRVMDMFDTFLMTVEIIFNDMSISFYSGGHFTNSFVKTSYTTYNSQTSKNDTNADDSLLCCKKRRVIKSCLGLCVMIESKARALEVVVGKCDSYLNDIKGCITKGNSYLRLRIIKYFFIFCRSFGLNF